MQDIRYNERGEIMRHFLFMDNETGEEFIVGADTLKEAKEIARDYFDAPRFSCELTDDEAEMSGLDEY